MTEDDRKLVELRAMLESATVEEGCSVFNHSAEEIGLEVMENHEAVIALFARITELSEQVEAKDVECQRLARINSGLCHDYNTISRSFYRTEDRALAAEAALAKAQGEVERLRGLLVPFALIAEHDVGQDEADDDKYQISRYNRAPHITIGHLRAARTALENHDDQ